MSETDIAFFSPEFAAAAREAINRGPSAEVKAGKLDKFWEWIDNAKQYIDCQLALEVTGLPEGGASALLLTFDQGRVTSAELVDAAAGRDAATYVLSGSLDDWRQIMAGFDIGKTIMYRKLHLAKGSVLEFFKSIYFWTEHFACVQRIPVTFA